MTDRIEGSMNLWWWGLALTLAMVEDDEGITGRFIWLHLHVGPLRLEVYI